MKTLLLTLLLISSEAMAKDSGFFAAVGNVFGCICLTLTMVLMMQIIYCGAKNGFIEVVKRLKNFSN